MVVVELAPAVALLLLLLLLLLLANSVDIEEEVEEFLQLNHSADNEIVDNEEMIVCCWC